MRRLLAAIALLLVAFSASAERAPGSKLRRRVPTATRVATNTPAPTVTPRATDTPANTAVPTATAIATPTPIVIGLISGVSYSTVSGSNFSTTNTTPTSITGLSVSVGASQTWMYEFHITSNSSSAAGLTFTMSVPSGGSFTGQFYCSQASATGVRNEFMNTSTTGSCNTVAADGEVTIWGAGNGGAGGTVQLQVSKVTSGTATIYINSYVQARRIA